MGGNYSGGRQWEVFLGPDCALHIRGLVGSRERTHSRMREAQSGTHRRCGQEFKCRSWASSPWDRVPGPRTGAARHPGMGSCAPFHSMRSFPADESYSYQHRIEIIPVRIFALDQIGLPVAPPLLHFIFAITRLRDEQVRLKPNQAGHAVLCCEKQSRRLLCALRLSESDRAPIPSRSSRAFDWRACMSLLAGSRPRACEINYPTVQMAVFLGPGLRIAHPGMGAPQSAWMSRFLVSGQNTKVTADAMAVTITGNHRPELIWPVAVLIANTIAGRRPPNQPVPMW